MNELTRFRERFTTRARTVFYVRILLCSFYAVFAIVPVADFHAIFQNSVLRLVLLSCFVAVGIAYHFSSHERLGRWIYFLSLLLDIGLATYVIVQTGGITSPFFAVTPLLVMLFTLIFPNPLMLLPAIGILPIVVTASPPAVRPLDTLMLLLFYAALFGAVIYLTNEVLAREEHKTRRILELEDQVRELAVLEERQRLARDIHDGVGGTLSSLSLQAELIASQLEQLSPLKNEAAEMQLLAQEAMDDMRRAIAVMRDEFDLKQQLGDVFKNFEKRFNIPVHLDHNLQVPILPYEKQLCILRIVQECITNTAKHAHATRIDVHMAVSAGVFRAEVADDGLGFLPGASPKNHYGLINMRDRAAKVNASIEFLTSPGKGTRVILTMSV